MADDETTLSEESNPFDEPVGIDIQVESIYLEMLRRLEGQYGEETIRHNLKREVEALIHQSYQQELYGDAQQQQMGDEMAQFER